MGTTMLLYLICVTCYAVGCILHMCYRTAAVNVLMREADALCSRYAPIVVK
jgi:hypothetical protein